MTNDNDDQRETIRENALKNLESQGLRYLSVSHNVHTNPNYGENDNGVSEQYLYAASIGSGINIYDPESGEEADLIRNSLQASRTGSRYSGSVTEMGLMRDADSIIKQSLLRVKASDIAEMVGYEGEIQEDAYIEDLDEETATTLISAYMGHNISDGLSRAYGERSNDIAGGLEDVLNPQEE